MGKKILNALTLVIAVLWLLSVISGPEDNSDVLLGMVSICLGGRPLLQYFYWEEKVSFMGWFNVPIEDAHWLIIVAFMWVSFGLWATFKSI